MIELLQHIPITIYLTTATAFVTATATLTGIHLTNRANNYRLALQQIHEMQIKQKELLREKLEELYCLVKEWESNLSLIYLDRTEVMSGDLDYVDAVQLNVKRGENSRKDFYRIEMLIDLYFSDIRPAYDELIKVRGKVNKIMLNHDREYEKGLKDGKKFVPEFLKAQNEFDAEVLKFREIIIEQSKHMYF